MLIGVTIGFSFLIVGLLCLFFGLWMFKMDLCYYFSYYLVMVCGPEFSYELIFDYLSLIYSGVVLYIGGSVCIYSEGYMQGDSAFARLIFLIVLFVISMLLMVMSINLVGVLLGWDGLGLSSYCLVIYYQNKNSFKAGMITLMSNRVGDSFLLLSVGLASMYGEWNYGIFSLYYDNLGMMYFLIVLSCFTKSAQLPFSAWLPEAMAAPTPVSSLVHSSTLVTAGIYLMVRFNFMFVDSWIMICMGLITMVVGSFNALVELDLKKIIAMSTLSQLGFMMLSLGLGFWFLAYFHMVMHAFFKALMFLSGGSIIYMFKGDQDLRVSGGLTYFSGISGVGIYLSVLCLGGLPFTCGFFSKDLIMEIQFMQGGGFLFYFIYLFGLSLSLIYSIRSLMMIYLTGLNWKASSMVSEDNWMSIGILMMSLASIVGGGIFSWLVMKELDFVGVALPLKLLALFWGLMIWLYFLMLEEVNSGFGIKLGIGYLMGGLFNLSYLSYLLPGKCYMGLFEFLDDDLTWVEETSGKGFWGLMVWLGNLASLQGIHLKGLLIVLWGMAMAIMMF